MSDTIEKLVNTIRERKNSEPDKSYTSSLLSGGLDKCIDKLEEEFGELKKALNTKKNEIHEAADLLYHLLVALEAADVKFDDVLKELEKRKKQSGLEEKNNRS
ncbi:MAG: phosphoribosyl-ATP diphosphatase [Pelagibacterales bacterium]|nr:phosphoribosyl-ATP diphosphatase [Pelagibacterales bacterium]